MTSDCGRLSSLIDKALRVNCGLACETTTAEGKACCRVLIRSQGWSLTLLSKLNDSTVLAAGGEEA